MIMKSLRDFEDNYGITNTQTAVTNMTIKRMLENKNSFNLTFRMFRHNCSSKTARQKFSDPQFTFCSF